MSTPNVVVRTVVTYWNVGAGATGVFGTVVTGFIDGKPFTINGDFDSNANAVDGTSERVAHAICDHLAGNGLIPKHMVAYAIYNGDTPGDANGCVVDVLQRTIDITV